TADLRVYMDEELLAGGHGVPARGVPHHVQNVDAFGVTVENGQGELEGITLARLGYVVDMGLDGEERMSGFTVGLVDPDEAEEGIGAVAECQQEARLAHVLVVVDPRFGNLRAIEHERSRQLTILAPLPSTGAFEWGSDP